ncbi:Os01g0289950, partial [Oryza sativa Japonica Group]
AFFVKKEITNCITSGSSGAFLRRMRRAMSAAMGCTIADRSNAGAGGDGRPRAAADHASMNRQKLWPSATAWCTATPTATPPPPPPPTKRVACTASTGAGSSGTSRLGTSRKNAGTSSLSVGVRAGVPPSTSTSRNATPSATADGAWSCRGVATFASTNSRWGATNFYGNSVEHVKNQTT